MAYLVLVRHGESLWNKQGLWTGLCDISLSEKGKIEAQIAAQAIKDISFDIAFISKLVRAKETLQEIKNILHITSIQTFEDAALNERDYGKYTGKNKWDMQKQLGEDAFKKLRRGWNISIPEGETLQNVYNRVVPYYQQHILPFLKNNRNVLIVAHGNSLRALVKYLENISDNDIQNLEIATGEILIYHMSSEGYILRKENRKTLIKNNS